MDLASRNPSYPKMVDEEHLEADQLLIDTSQVTTQPEFDLIQSMYPTQFRWLPSSPPDSRSSFELSLDSLLRDGSDPGLYISVDIPSDYPIKSLPKIVIKSESMSRDDQARLNKDYQTWIDSDSTDKPPKGEICLDILINKVLELASEFSPKTSSTQVRVTDQGQSKTCDSNVSIPDHLDMAWSVFWMHHIMATSKRKNIVEWARELHIRGWSKPG